MNILIGIIAIVVFAVAIYYQYKEQEYRSKKKNGQETKEYVNECWDETESRL